MNVAASKRERGKLHEHKAINIWLDSELQDKKMKLKYCRDVVLVETRIERDELKVKRDNLRAQVESLSSTEKDLERMRKLLDEAREKGSKGSYLGEHESEESRANPRRESKKGSRGQI